MTGKLPKYLSIIIGGASLALLGASCTINLGGSAPADGGIWRSDDHGQTWQQKVFISQEKKQIVSLNEATVRSFAFDRHDPSRIYIGTRENGIWYTINAGDQWQATSLRSGNYECLDLDPQNSDIIYTAAGSVIIKSIDGGQTWKQIYTESQPGHAVQCVAVDTFQPNIIWATTSGGKILNSTDYGLTWTLVQTLVPLQPRLIYIEPDGSGKITIFTRTSGIFVGTSQGRKWEELTKNLSAFPGATDIRDVKVLGTTNQTWWLATTAGALTSADRGVTWKLIPTLVTPGSIAVQNIAVNPNNYSELFITYDQRLHHTVNGGADWSVSNIPTRRVPVFLVFDPANAERMFFSTFKNTKK